MYNWKPGVSMQHFWVFWLSELWRFVGVHVGLQCIERGEGLSRRFWISSNDTFPLYSGIYNVTTRIYTYYEIPANYSYLQWTGECVLWEEEKCSSCSTARPSHWQFVRSSPQTECGVTIRCLVLQLRQYGCTIHPLKPGIELGPISNYLVLSHFLLCYTECPFCRASWARQLTGEL